MPIIGFSLGIGKGIALPLDEAGEGRAVAAPAVDPDTMKKSAKVSAVACSSFCTGIWGTDINFKQCLPHIVEVVILR